MQYVKMIIHHDQQGSLSPKQKIGLIFENQWIESNMLTKEKRKKINEADNFVGTQEYLLKDSLSS